MLYPSKAFVLVALLDEQRALGEVFVPNPDLEYHIQTDQGPDRFFRFQTSTGQYRKEQQHPDGSVTGSYGWIDPNGVFRLFDYISDNLGYRIERKRLFKVLKPTDKTNSVHYFAYFCRSALRLQEAEF